MKQKESVCRSSIEVQDPNVSTGKEEEEEEEEEKEAGLESHNGGPSDPNLIHSSKKKEV